MSFTIEKCGSSGARVYSTSDAFTDAVYEVVKDNEVINEG